MIDRAGKAYLMDFGRGCSVEATQDTMAGTVLGTIEYMSPEQANGEPADFRSDIYTMGIILFELFTGARPFKGDTPMSRLAARVNQQAPDPRVTHPDLPAYLSQIIVRCLETLPLSVAISASRRCLPISTRKATERPWRVVWRRTASWKLAVAAVVMLGGCRGVSLRRAPTDARTRRSGDFARGRSDPRRWRFCRSATPRGSPILAWLGTSLAEMLRTDVGQSAYLRAVSSDWLDQTLRDLHLSADAGFDADSLRRLSEFTNADTLVWGQYLRVGGQIRI